MCEKSSNNIEEVYDWLCDCLDYHSFKLFDHAFTYFKIESTLKNPGKNNI